MRLLKEALNVGDYYLTDLRLMDVDEFTGAKDKVLNQMNASGLACAGGVIVASLARVAKQLMDSNPTSSILEKNVSKIAGGVASLAEGYAFGAAGIHVFNRLAWIAVRQVDKENKELYG